MRDKELYSRILGIEKPWHVKEVELELEKGKVTVILEYSKDALRCPECGKVSPGYDHKERSWRHLDTCQYMTVLTTRIPRIKCREHGVHQIRIPWAEPGSRFTALFEGLVIDWLHEASKSALAERLRMSWSEVDTIMEQAVRRGLGRRAAVTAKRIGIDETSFQKRHEYVTVVNDQESGAVLYVADDRGESSLHGFYESLSEEQLKAISAVAMDMWNPYIKSTMKYVPDADKKIAFDKYHVAKHLGDAVNKVRIEEHRQLKANGRNDLKKTRFLWLMNPEHMDERLWKNFEPLRNSNLRTARAWAIKEFAMTLWSYITRGWALRAWKRWLSWAMRSRLEPIKKAGKMISTYLWGIINAIVLKITNARSESINAQIQKLKARACGFRNRERFRTAIYFHLGRLDLYPDSLKGTICR